MYSYICSFMFMPIVAKYSYCAKNHPNGHSPLLVIKTVFSSGNSQDGN